VQCNIHPWMHGWFVVVKGPYATTDAAATTPLQCASRKLYGDSVAGDLGTQAQKVTVAAGGAGSANFTFKPK